MSSFQDFGLRLYLRPKGQLRLKSWDLFETFTHTANTSTQVEFCLIVARRHLVASLRALGKPEVENVRETYRNHTKPPLASTSDKASGWRQQLVMRSSSDFQSPGAIHLVLSYQGQESSYDSHDYLYTEHCQEQVE